MVVQTDASSKNKLLSLLIQNVAGSHPTQEPERHERLIQYSEQVLQSSFTPALPVHDMELLSNHIKKRLMQEDPSGEKSLAFTHAESQLIEFKYLEHTWGILYFLYQMSIQNQYASQSERATPSIVPESIWKHGPFVTQEPRQPVETRDLFIIRSLGNWQSYMSQTGLISEEALLRELFVVMQGSESQLFRHDESSESYCIDPTCRISQSNKNVALELCQAASLCRKIEKFIELRKANERFQGLINFSLCHWLQQFLEDYYKTVASLQTLVDRHVDSEGQLESSCWMVGKGLGLRRLYVLLKAPCYRLRIVGWIMDKLRDAQGTFLINAVHGFLGLGDPMALSLVESLLKELNRSVLEQVEAWLFEGRLADPFEEFFVAMSKNLAMSEDSIWQSKFAIEASKQTYYIDASTAQKILSAGKSMWFLKNMCPNITMPKIDRVSLVSDAKMSADLAVGKVDSFASFVGAIYDRLAPLLLCLMRESHVALDRHLDALKRYLLCERGDFVQALMDRLSVELSKPATHLYRHNLIGNLDDVMKKLLAVSETEDIIRRIDVRLLKPTKNESGWETFSLDYHVDHPLNSLLTAPVMANYLKAFRFSWRLKRCEYVLSNAWKVLCITGRSLSEALLMECQFVLRVSHAALTEMLKFVEQFLHYLMIEVVEASWSVFKSHAEKAKDLDAYIAAHSDYLEKILMNGVFSQRRQEDEYLRQTQQKLYQLLQIVLSFTKHQAALHKTLKESNQAYKRMDRQMEERTKRGQWGLSETEEAENAQIKSNLLNRRESITSEIVKLAAQFKIEVKSFLDILSSHRLERPLFGHLVSLLNYNNIYKV